MVLLAEEYGRSVAQRAEIEAYDVGDRTILEWKAVVPIAGARYNLITFFGVFLDDIVSVSE